jgi:hypothetical protein
MGLSFPKHHVLNPYHRLKDLFIRFFAFLRPLLFLKKDLHIYNVPSKYIEILKKDLHRYNMPSKYIEKE